MRFPKMDYAVRYARLTRLGHWLRDRYGSLPMATLIKIDDRQRIIRQMAEYQGLPWNR